MVHPDANSDATEFRLSRGKKEDDEKKRERTVSFYA